MALADEAGNTVKPISDFSAITPEDEEYMKSIPGVHEAWSGAQKFKFSIVEVQGSKLTLTSALQGFAGCPANIRSELTALVEHFDENFGDYMKGVLESTAMEKSNQDVRPVGSGSDPVETPVVGGSDEATVRANANITVECKGMDCKDVLILGDADGNAWLVAKDDCYHSDHERATIFNADLVVEFPPSSRLDKM